MKYNALYRPGVAEPVYCTMRSVPLFVYLMESRSSTYVGVATNPFQRVSSHNRTGPMASGNKSTRRGAPHWTVVLVIG